MSSPNPYDTNSLIMMVLSLFTLDLTKRRIIILNKLKKK